MQHMVFTMLKILKLCKITYIYIGSCFCLHVSLRHIAALVLYGFSLMFFYWYIPFACCALTNSTFPGPCIMIYRVGHGKVVRLPFAFAFWLLY